MLVMSYANMKPMDSKAHEHIAAWVRGGGKLLFCGTDADPYQRVQEWWNRGGNAYTAPSQHLFDCSACRSTRRRASMRAGRVS